MNKLTIDDIRRRASELSDTVVISDEYKNNHEKLRFRCSCGNEFERTWLIFTAGHYKCFSCGSKDSYNKKRLDLQAVISKLEEYEVEYMSGAYLNQKSILDVRFKCGHYGKLRYNNVFSKSFSGLCPSCARADGQRYNIFTVSLEASVLFGVEIISNEYIDSQTPLRVKCSCGNEYSACWNNIKSGHQVMCSVCSKKTSRGEIVVKKWLDDHGIDYVQEKKFIDCGDKKPFPFDFYLPNNNTCIEFDGYQHYRPEKYWGGDETYARIRAHDAAKTEYCKAKGIDLIRIPYTEINKIDDILSSKVIPR